MSVNLNRARPYSPRSLTERSSRKEESQQSIGAGYALPSEPAASDSNLGGFNPILSSHTVDVEYVNPGELEAKLYSLGLFSEGVLSRYISDAAVVSMVIRILNDARVLDGLHVLHIPSLSVLSRLLDRYGLSGVSSSVPVSEVVLMGLLGGISSFRHGAIGMVDRLSLGEYIPANSIDMVLLRLQKMGVISSQYEIMMIPTYDEFERVFGKRLARLGRVYLMARRGHWVVGGDSAAHSGWLSALMKRVLGEK